MSIVTSITLAFVLSVFPVENTDTSPQQSGHNGKAIQSTAKDVTEVAAHDNLQNAVDTPKSRLTWISKIA